MKKLVLLGIIHACLVLYCCPLFAMEDQEEFLAEVINKGSYSILRQIRYMKKTSLEALARKPRKIKTARRGINAPPCSPELPETEDLSLDLPGLPLMVFENTDKVTDSAQETCLICSVKYASCHGLRDHMFYVHHIFLCVCNMMYQDCDLYREHCKTCSIFQEAKQAD
jgi:hypothetical protein